MKSKRLLLMLLVALLAPWAANAQQTLTVCDGTSTSSYAPIKSNGGSQTEFIYPASLLGDMEGGTITSVKFFSSSTSTTNYSNTVTVFVEEVASSTVSSSAWQYNQSTATKVYEGTTLSVTGGELVITFSTPYEYNGGNLCFNIWSASDTPSVNYYYLATTNSCGYDWYITPPVSVPYSTGSYLPKAEFTYTAVATCCPKPKNLTCTGYSATTATFTWTNGGEETQWQLEYGTASDFTGASTVTINQSDLVNGAYTLTSLTAEQTHYARIKAYCASCTPNYSDPSNTCEFKPSAVQNLTVNDESTTNSYIPIYGSYVDYGNRSQFIIPAASITDMTGATINKITLYATQSSTTFTNDEFSVYMKEVSSATFASTAFEDWSSLTEVYSGSVSISNNKMEITFSTPYTYDGGNLLIGFHQTAYNTTVSCTWKGTAQTGSTALYQTANSSHSWTGTVTSQSFLPKTTFTYLPTSTPKPRNLQVTEKTSESAILTWEAPANATPMSYLYHYKKATDAYFNQPIDIGHDLSVTLNELAANTEYNFGVYANYSEGMSDYAEITFTTEATCLVPEGLAVTDMVATWTVGTATRWNLQYKKSVDTEWTPVDGLTAATYNFANANLDAITNYDVQVRADCGNGDLSEWTATVSFTTPCATYDIPYTYGFEDAAPFECWTVISGTVSRQSGTTNSGSYRLDFRGTTSNMIALPQFNEPTNNLRVEFWTRPESMGGSSGKFAIGYMTDITDASTFVAVETYNSTEMTTTYVKKTVDFVNVPANANIAMRQFDCATNYYWYVDDVTVKLIPSCLAPSGLSATVTAHEAELSWTANSGETAWTLYWKKTTDENYTDVANATNPYTLNGLDAATNYQYYVVANCSADDASEASEVFPFVTECEVIAALGYSENFDGYTVASNATAPSTRVLPTCWNAINTTTYSTYSVFPTIYYYSYTNYANSTPNSLKFYSFYSTYGSYDPQPQYAILPEMSSLAGKEIVLYARGYNTSSTFKIGTMSDPEDASTFNLIAEQTELTTAYQKFSYIIPADRTDSYLAIMIDAATSSRTTNGVYIDDITVKEMVTVDADEIVAANPGEGQMTWSQFAEHVNNGHHFTNTTFTLMNDITINEMVGTAENPFTGTFDGNGKTITANITSGETAAAPFHYIKDATIKNLTMTGTVTETATTSDGYHAGGLVGYAWSGYNIIENCRVSTNVTIAGYGGGIVGHGKTSVVFLKGCVYDGTITNALNVDGNNKGVGGLVGWFDGGAALNIHDSYYNGTYTENEGVSVYFHPVACKTGGASVTVNIYDCYYTCDNPAADSDGTNNVVTNAGQKAYKVTGAEDITVDLRAATTHYSCSGISGDDNATWNGIKIGDDIYGGEGVTLTLALEGANGYVADHGTLTPISTTYTLLMEASDTEISGVDCPVPYNVYVDAPSLTAHSARVYWNGGSDSYTVEYGEVVDVPTTYDFEDQTIPANFTNDANYPWVIASSGHSSSYSIKSSNNGNHSTTSSIEMPVVLASGSTLSFYCLASCESASNYWDYGIFYIDGEQQDRFLHVTEWQHKTYELAAGTHTLKWTFTKDGSGEGGDDCFYVDDITITSSAVNTWTTLSNITASPYTIENLNPETTYQVKVSGTCDGVETDYSDVVEFTTPASCIVPTGLVVSDVTTNSAYASWTAGGSETLYVVAYKKATDAEWTEVENRVDQTFYTLSNLDAATDYEVKVQAYCDADDQSDWTDAVSFTTECETIVVTGSWSEGFEGGDMPACWSQDGNATWTVGTGDGNTSTGAHTGTYNAKITHNTSGYVTKLITPVLDLTSLNNPMLTFWYINRQWGNDIDGFAVYYRTAEDAEWTQIDATEEAHATWTEATYMLPNPSATYQIAFEMTDGYGYGVGIDDITIAPSFTKTIAAVGEEGWESGKGGYYFIASPVAEPVTPTANNGFIVGDYDLYYFSQATDGEGNEWINFKDETLGGYNLTNGKGYLYASKEGTTLTFTGTPGTNGTVTLDAYDADARFKGWNLIGNPFAEDAYINKPFYTLENSDTYTSNEAGTAIQAMQGVLIIAAAEETTVTFTTEAPAAKNSKLNMNLRRDNKQLDNAILVFGGEQQLGKMTFRANSSKIFMPVEGKDYAITSVEGQVGEVPVSFKAENNGTYSLSFISEEVSFSYLHLIDNMTGADVNLLQTPSYTFDARTSDYESRFRLVFATGSSTGSDTFGFVNASGNFCIFGIEGEATVQVIDVLGHVLSSETFSGSYEKHLDVVPGVYMIRLIQGNDIRVQKMVVR